MNIIKLKDLDDIPEYYTGIIEWEDGELSWLKDGNRHREDGPARIHGDDFKSWWLDGKPIWNSLNKLDLTNEIILSKEKHPEYPLVQVWKILGPNGLYRQIVIPGMEEYIQE